MKQSYYFSHDSDAKDDPKCVLLIEQLGLEGYGIYWVLIETLRNQENYKYPISLIPALARRYNTSAEKVKTVVYNYELFSVENDMFFYSDSLLNRMEKYESKCIKASLAGKLSAEKKKLILNSTNVEQTLNVRTTTVQPNKEKKRKEKEKKVNNIISIEIRNKKFIEDLRMFESQYGKDILNEFYRYWGEVGQNTNKMRFELQKTWELSKRLATWYNNSIKFNKNGKSIGNNTAESRTSKADRERNERANFIMSTLERGIAENEGNIRDFRELPPPF